MNNEISDLQTENVKVEESDLQLKTKMAKGEKSLIKHSLKLSMLTLGSRILGLVREAVRGNYLGTSKLADAFSISFMIPNLLRRLFAENSISVAFIPTFQEYLERDDKKETREFLSATLTMLSFLVTLATVIGIIITPFIISFFGTMPEESTFLTRLMFPYLILISLAALFQGILNGVKIFSPSGFTPILFNTAVIISTIIFSKFVANPARAMAIGVVLGGALQCCFQIPFVLKKGFRFGFTSLKKAFSHPGTKTILKLICPTIIGMAAYQLNDVVSSALAGNAGEGVVSSLQYSLRIQELILGIFAVSIGTVILPDLTGFATRKEWPGFNEMLKRAMNIIAMITIPVTFFSLICGESIISIIYQGKAFSESSVRLTMDAFTWHISGLYFIALNRIISPAFYAQKDVRSPTLAGIISFGVNILVALVLVIPFKGKGIAFALSFASFVNTIILFIFMRKKETINVKQMIHSTVFYSLKLVLFSFIASVPLYFIKPIIYNWAKTTALANLGKIGIQGVPLVLCGLIFAIIGIGLLVITKDPILKSLLGGLKKNVQKKN